MIEALLYRGKRPAARPLSTIHLYYFYYYFSMHWNSSTCNLLGTSHSIFYTLITSLLGVLRSTVVVFSQGKNCSSSCSCINCLNKPIKTKK